MTTPPLPSRRESRPSIHRRLTFLAVANEWHTRQTPGWTRKHASQVWRSLDIDILPTLGPRPIDEIQSREIMAVIERIEDRGAGEIATRVLQRVRAVFSCAVALGYREVNPASELHNHLKPRNEGTADRACRRGAAGVPARARDLQRRRRNPAGAAAADSHPDPHQRSP